MRLLATECRRVLRSLPYLIFIAALLLMYVTNYRADGLEKLQKPSPNQASYGMKEVELPEVIMPVAIQMLQMEFANNSYTAYPYGFYKTVVLSEAKQREMAEHLALLTEASPSLSYEQFKQTMEQVDQLIGGGSQYGESFLVSNFGQVPKSYEDAQRDYAAIIEQDHISGAYARIFADYIGIIAGLLPAFIAAALALRDRKDGLYENLYPRSIRSWRFIASRYAAIAAMVMLPILLLSGYETYAIASSYPEQTIDYFAFFKYSLGWLLPTVLVVAAASLLITEWSGTAIAVALQFAWWFMTLMVGIPFIDGGKPGLLYMPRHNALGNTELFAAGLEDFIWNRLLYAALSLVLVAVTVIIYEKKRRGMRSGRDWLAQRLAHRRS